MHLSAERLAAFDHEPFTIDELAHLAACATCRAERDAMMTLVSLAAAEAPRAAAEHAPRLVTWESIAAGLRTADAMSEVTPGTMPDMVSDVTDVTSDAASDHTSDVMPIATPGPMVGARVVPVHAGATPDRLWGSAFWRRAAAAVLLLGGGTLLGRVTAHQDVGQTMAQVALGNALGDGEFTSVERATEVLTRAQRDYERASMWLASNDSTTRSSEVYRARLAALDQMMAASRAALRDAPQDPVLNHYYLAAWTAREATLQALGGTLPVDKVIERY